jgi:hypothetical protein
MFPGQAGNPTDQSTLDPEHIRKEVIPTLIRMGQQGRDSGSINELQFRDLMQQIMILKESSLVREAENKENRRGHFGPGQTGLLGPPPDQMEGKPPRPAGLLDPPPMELSPCTTRSPHKNDLPMADPALLEEIDVDPTKCLNIDDVARTIRYYGETATIVMEDNRICELAFQAEPEARRIVVDEGIVVFHQVNTVPTGPDKYDYGKIRLLAHTICCRWARPPTRS